MLARVMIFGQDTDMKQNAINIIRLLAACAMLALYPAMPAMAQQLPDGFATGPVFTDYGPHAPIDSDTPLPADFKLAVAFDVAEGSAGELNRTLFSATRFINMHAANGVSRENISVAIVVHGPAVFDMAVDDAYVRKYAAQKSNPNAPLVAALLAAETGVDVHIIICGQSASAQGLVKSELLPGVTMELSAMTAHARLQQGGFTLNPF